MEPTNPDADFGAIHSAVAACRTYSGDTQAFRDWSVMFRRLWCLATPEQRGAWAQSEDVTALCKHLVDYRLVLERIGKRRVVCSAPPRQPGPPPGVRVRLRTGDPVVVGNAVILPKTLGTVFASPEDCPPADAEHGTLTVVWDVVFVGDKGRHLGCLYSQPVAVSAVYVEFATQEQHAR